VCLGCGGCGAYFLNNNKKYQKIYGYSGAKRTKIYVSKKNFGKKMFVSC